MNERIKTNHLLIDILNCSDEFTVKSIYDDATAKQLYENIANILDETFNKHLAWLDTPEAAKYFKTEAKYKTEMFNDLDQDIMDLLSDNKKSVDTIIENIYETGAKQGYKDIKRHVTFTEQDKTALRNLKEYNYNLIRNVNADTIQTIREEIQAGLIEGKGVSEIAERIKDRKLEPLDDSTLSPYQRALTIARTEKSRAENNAILQSYANYNVKLVDWMTKGVNVCTICLECEEKNPYKITEVEELIPRHPNCGCRWTAHLDDTIDTEPTNNSLQINSANTQKKQKYKEYTTDEYTMYGKDEKFNVREYNDVTIKLGEGIDYTSFKQIKQLYDSLPENVKIYTKEIRVSAKLIKSGRSTLGGYHRSNKPSITLYKPESEEQFIHTFYHELGHLFDNFTKNKLTEGKYEDKNSIYNISNSKEYRDMVKKDYVRKPAEINGEILRKPNGKPRMRTYKTYPSDYARSTYKKNYKEKLHYREYSEDFAESMSLYLQDNKQFKEKFPNRCKLIEELVYGEYN
ncbi:phage minor head protein [uncultured Methanobrevibacter sp.]|uniref:phage minor head protein n=1 Tax=uncultured Methanobrevibacter sp. TaxID=253161 RepID=UPI00260A64BD|nr:phage minor head protein [uncultured Methanobrevibacter sp.]